MIIDIAKYLSEGHLYSRYLYCLYYVSGLFAVGAAYTLTIFRYKQFSAHSGILSGLLGASAASGSISITYKLYHNYASILDYPWILGMSTAGLFVELYIYRRKSK